MIIRKRYVVTSFLPILVLLLVIEVNDCEAGELKKCYKTDPSKQTYKENGLRCELCSPGSFRTAHCTDTGQTRCENCPFNTYMPYNNTCEECWLCTEKCTGLYQFVKQECNGTHPRVCGCPDGTYPSADNAQCFRRFCDPGERLRIRGKYNGSVKCRKCLPNTYSSSQNRWSSCTPHTNCTALGRDVLWRGNSTHDAVCKTKDHNSLTAETTAASTSKNDTTSLPEANTMITIQPTTKRNPTTPHANTSTSTENVSGIQSHPTTNKSSDGPNSQNNDSLTIGLSVGGSVLIAVIVIAVTCTWFLCCRKKKRKRKYRKPKREIKRCAPYYGNPSDSSEKLTPPNSSGRVLSKQITSWSKLLQKNIILKRGKTPESLFDGISSGCRTGYWKKFLRNTPPPSLTDNDIETIEYDYRGFHEIVYQCLRKWKKKQCVVDDPFPVKDLLHVLYQFDKKLVKQLIVEYCEEVTSSDDS